ncbi:MAG: carbon-nitrogen hydrolase family protein [Pirellulaceae bacterium]|nr:carbon-nitrogen hydrolase family protein [Pirellulaceae bacterium]
MNPDPSRTRHARWTSILAVGLLAVVSASTAWAAEPCEPRPSGKLRLAVCQFPISADIAANGRWIRSQLAEAAEKKADLVHFPETALSGYAASDHETLDGLDWDLLRRETESILALAKKHGLWVVLGSTHRLGDGHKPHNSLYVVNPEGRVVDRYDKRFCTEGDLRHYSPGNRSVVFEVNGVKCGLLICHDYRYPELYREYARRGVHLMLHSFYNAFTTMEATEGKLCKEYAQVYASMNHFFVSYTNTSRPCAWPSCFVTPDGRVEAVLPTHQAAVEVREVDLSRKYDDPSGAFRGDALRGKLHSGQTVDDPRATDRKSWE